MARGALSQNCSSCQSLPEGGNEKDVVDEVVNVKEEVVLRFFELRESVRVY